VTIKIVQRWRRIKNLVQTFFYHSQISLSLWIRERQGERRSLSMKNRKWFPIQTQASIFEVPSLTQKVLHLFSHFPSSRRGAIFIFDFSRHLCKNKRHKKCKLCNEIERVVSLVMCRCRVRIESDKNWVGNLSINH
jgi:hypothetical protein